MTSADYEAIGFMSGLEVHQQLDTRSKLFCRCPAGRRVTRVDAEVLRHMRPTLSELGEYDGTALMEFKTKKEIVYLLERGTVCTYEMDDTPPFEIDDEAVRIAIEMSELCNLNLVSELHVMRKQYLDGSIPTGFQRTAMVGLSGAIPFQVPELGVNRELSIRQLSLEEDSCREVSDIGHRITFRTDRLGMPLTEMVTEPELLTPLELQAGGRLLAHLARTTGKVRRGPGAGRQDVNVSVSGGRRVEIKGVHHHRRLPLLVHTEAFRQLNLLRVKAELERRGVTPDALKDPPKGFPWDTSALVMDAEAAVADTSFPPIRKAISRGETVCAVLLPGFAGLLSHPTQPGFTFAHEISDRVRVIACPVHVPFLAHSEIGRGGLISRHWKVLERAFGAGPGDAMVVVWAPSEDAATAAREIVIRAREALEGVPAETRQAHPNGTNGFERILPGPDRMYPDTDTPPLPIPDRTVTEVRAQLGEPPWTRQARYEELGLDARMARSLAVAPWADLFDKVAPHAGEPARRLAGSLEKRIPFHARRRGASSPRTVGEAPDADRLSPVVRALEGGEIRQEALVWALDDLLADPDRAVAEVLDNYRPRQDDEAELEAAVPEIAQMARTLQTASADGPVRWAMGMIMRRFFGRVDPASVRERLRSHLTVGEPLGNGDRSGGSERTGEGDE
ncbi:MAG: Glu-tRNA(Gln) amidotransferase subunit GatE [Gemmatimonadetes bacterium]|nr:Glu-tRNA(Gln) amidotransferase subunit GatE [Gemmatimonadota bacterium]